MSESQLTIRPKASQQLAALIGMEPGAMLDAIKAQCFKGNSANITNEQLAAFVSIAAEMGVNPFLPDMLYAFPGQGGSIIPIMGPSGVYKKLMEHPDVDSWETTVFPEDVALPPTHATTKIWRKGRDRPLQYTALMSEWRIGQNPNWANRPRHMISLRSLKHCARQIIHGIPYDADDRVILESEINVTPGAPEDNATIVRKDPPKREKKGAAAVQENAKPADKAIDVETVPPKAVEPSATEPTKLAAPPKADEPKKVEPVVEPAQSTAKKSTLADKEEFHAICTVDKFWALMVTSQGVLSPSVQANVSGDFVGTVLHIGGGTNGPDSTIIADPLWQTGSKVLLLLKGRLSPKSGKINTIVEKIAPAEATSESPTMEVG